MLNPLTNVKLNLWTYLEIEGGYGEKQISDYNSRMALSGATLGVSLSKERISEKLSWDKQTIEATGHGNLEYSLLIDGLLKVYEKPVSISLKHTI